MKNISFISVLISVIFLLLFILFIFSGGGISIIEFAPVGIIFGLWSMSYSALAMVFNKDKLKRFF